MSTLRRARAVGISSGLSKIVECDSGRFRYYGVAKVVVVMSILGDTRRLELAPGKITELVYSRVEGYTVASARRVEMIVLVKVG